LKQDKINCKTQISRIYLNKALELLNNKITNRRWIFI